MPLVLSSILCDVPARAHHIYIVLIQPNQWNMPQEGMFYMYRLLKQFHIVQYRLQHIALSIFLALIIISAYPTLYALAITNVTAIIKVGTSPNGIGINPVTNRIYVANYGNNTVSAIDGTNNVVVDTIPVGSLPISIGVNPTTNRVYVANLIGNTVSVIDSTTDMVIGSPILVGRGPQAVGINSITNSIYVVNTRDNSVSVIDGATSIVTKTVVVGSLPIGIGVNSNTNRVYVANLYGNTVSVLDGITNTVIGTPISVGSAPQAIGVNDVTNRIYVANNASGTISVIDGIANTLVGSPIFVGRAPQGIGVNTFTNHIYVTNSGSNTVSVVDGATNTVSNTISVGSFPIGVGTNANTNRIYVANSSDNTVSVIGNGPSFSAAFSPSITSIAGSSTLTLTLSNTANDFAASNIGFTLNLPSGLIVANLPTSPQCGGTVSSTTTTVTLMGGSITSGLSSCTISIGVTSASINTYTVDQTSISFPMIPINVFSASLSVIAPPATHFIVTGFPSPVISGTAANVVVESLDASNNPTANYRGTVKITSSDAQAALPINATLINGVGTFSVALKTAGMQSITATDITNTSIVGIQNNIVVNPSAATQLVFIQQPTNTVVGSTIIPLITVAFEDAYNNVVTTNTSSVMLAINSGTLNGTLLVAAVNGVATFNGISVSTAGTYTLTASATGLTDVVSNSFTVAKAATTTTLTSRPNPSMFGQSVTFTANVTPTGATGMVIFTVDGTAIISATLTAGTATLVTSTLTMGAHTVSATYSGDTNYTGSASTVLTQAVIAATFTPTNTATATPTASLTATRTSTVTASPTNSPTATSSPTATPTTVPLRKPDTIGVYRPSTSTFYLRGSNTQGFADLTIQYGNWSSYPVVGDWTGAGQTTIGVFDRTSGSFQLRNSNTPGASDETFTLGLPGDLPLAGRWLASAKHDGVGVFRPSNGLIYLKNDLSTGYADYTMVLGIPGDAGVAGDWTDSGMSSPGVYRPSLQHFYLSNQVTNGPVYGDLDLQLGNAGDVPFAGDWIVQGHAGVGVFRPTNGLIYLKNALTTGYADVQIVYGVPNDIPVAGHWGIGSLPPPQVNSLLVPNTALPAVATATPTRSAIHQTPPGSYDG